MRDNETSATLHDLRAALNERGVKATGPHRGLPTPEWDYLSLPGGRHVHVQRDDNGYWQALVYKGDTLARIADVDATGWPGDRA